MNSLFLSHRRYFSDRSFLKATIASAILLLVAIIVNYYAGSYATEHASNSVTDVILSNIPVVNVEDIFIYGTFIFWYIVLYIGIARPQSLPFALKSIALFVLIRSLFISLTHLGPFPDEIVLDPSSLINKFTFGADQFFSAHTGLPFLLALIFWDTRRLRYFFILSAIAFGAIVLLGHLHYSIDVLSAFFITYTIYHIARFLFKKEYGYFVNGIPEKL